MPVCVYVYVFYACLMFSSLMYTCSGTMEGDVLIINSSKMQVQMTVKKAHLIVVTALTFSHDSRLELLLSITLKLCVCKF